MSGRVQGAFAPILIILMALAIGLLACANAAAQAVKSSDSVAPKALILGVPFISFRAASHLTNDPNLHPSFAAAEAMTFRYWGQDAGLDKDKAAFAKWGVAQRGQGKSLDDLKLWIGRGTPVYVRPALTAVADAPSPVVAHSGESGQ